MSKLGSSAIASLFLASCAPQAAEDPSAPAEYIYMAPPDWTGDYKLDVKKRFCSITDKTGQEFNVASNGTDLGNGMIASRDKRDCYIRDSEGMQCNWNTSEKIEWCRMSNPAYGAYQNAKHNAHF